MNQAMSPETAKPKGFLAILPSIGRYECCGPGMGDASIHVYSEPVRRLLVTAGTVWPGFRNALTEALDWVAERGAYAKGKWADWQRDSRRAECLFKREGKILISLRFIFGSVALIQWDTEAVTTEELEDAWNRIMDEGRKRLEDRAAKKETGHDQAPA